MLSCTVKTKTIEIQKALREGNKSKRERYAELVIGKSSWGALFLYEFVVSVAANRSGALGLWLRSKLYPLLLNKCGKDVIFGQGVTLRHPHKIELGDHVVVDDHVLLDAKGTDNTGIKVGDGTFIGRNSILSCKNGDIELGTEVNIGFNCEVVSASTVKIGSKTLLAAYTYIIGANHESQDVERSILEQGRVSHGVEIGEGVWLGAGCKVLDGKKIGDHAIVGAGSVVHRNVPAYHVAAGIPARVLRDRREG
jgi:acetyltransferase-like isoleucine patch superfamily enzyme